MTELERHIKKMERINALLDARNEERARAFAAGESRRVLDEIYRKWESTIRATTNNEEG